MTISYDRFIGIDQAKEKHDMCIIDSNGKIIFERGEIKHSLSGIEEIIKYISKHCENNFDRVAVAIEVPHGAVVESLMEKGISVYSINPKQLDRFRDRYTVAGAKDDCLDAFVLADSLRTDLRCFKKVSIPDPVIIELREVSRYLDELTKQKTRFTNQLDTEVNRFFPQLFEISPQVDKEWIWKVLQVIISDQKIQRNQIREIVKTFKVRRATIDEIINTIKSHPLNLAPGTIDGIKFKVEILVSQLQLVQSQIKKCRRRVKELLNQIKIKEKKIQNTNTYSDVEIILSMPGVGDIITSILLTEASQLLSSRNYEGLRLMSGVAPVTMRSGKKSVVCMRRACNKRLRNAMYHWARVSKQNDKKCLEYYQRSRKKGQSDGRALRGLADRLLRILMSMLRSNTLYNPNHNQQINRTENKVLPIAA